MANLILDQFLGAVVQTLRTKNGERLKDILLIEPPLPQAYAALADELRRTFPRGPPDRLENRIGKLLAQEDGDLGGSWSAFVSFLVSYFGFVRDVNPDQLLETYELLKNLLK